MDQRENARREQERARIANLSGSDKERAQELEDAVIQAFEKQKEIRLSVLGEANVNISARSYYCPVQECAISEGGTGFETKDEMFRHWLVHGSPS